MAASCTLFSGFGRQSSDSITFSGSVNVLAPLTMGSTVPLETSFSVVSIVLIIYLLATPNKTVQASIFITFLANSRYSWLISRGEN